MHTWVAGREIAARRGRRDLAALRSGQLDHCADAVAVALMAGQVQVIQWFWVTVLLTGCAPRRVVLTTASMRPSCQCRDAMPRPPRIVEHVAEIADTSSNSCRYCAATSSFAIAKHGETSWMLSIRVPGNEKVLPSIVVVVHEAQAPAGVELRRGADAVTGMRSEGAVAVVL